MHMEAMLYRLFGEGLITSEQLESYKSRKVLHAAASLGFDTSLYKPSRDEKAYRTFGFYIKQAQELLDKEKISEGKYEQLLLEAFRSDLVYGDEQEEEELDDWFSFLRQWLHLSVFVGEWSKLASNNLRDISHYISKYKLAHVTTGDILVEAMKQGLIDEAQGNAIWASMVAKRRKLGAATFSDYLKMKG